MRDIALALILIGVFLAWVGGSFSITQTPEEIDVDDEMSQIMEILSQYETVTFGDTEYPDVVVDLLNGRIDVLHDADEDTQEFWDYAQLYLEYQRNR